MAKKRQKRNRILTAVPAAVAVCVAAAAIPWLIPPEPPETFTLDASPREAFEQAQERREGWHIDDPVIINCGPVPKDATLRLGFYHAGNHDSWLKRRASFEARAGDRRVACERVAGGAGWYDYRFDLPSDAKGDVTVTLRPALGFFLSHCSAFSRQATPPAAFVFLIDALRLDHMSCYDYERDTTPNIRAFSEDAVRFMHLMPSASWTRPSVASLLTSTYPEVHGAQDRPDIMRQGMPSLAESLQQAGYETLGFMSNPNCLPQWGFGDGFHRYVDVDSFAWKEALDEGVIDRVLEALPLDVGRPRFMYIHTMAPHRPYAPPEPYDTRYGNPMTLRGNDQDLCLYDGEVAYIDAQFARFIEALKAQGVYEQSLIVLLSDHGENLGDHGQTGHGNNLYESLLRVPLLVKLPGNACGGETRSGVVEMADIAPTLLELLGVPPNPDFAGTSFAGLVHGNGAGKPVGYASLRLWDCELRTAKTTEIKLIEDLAKGSSRWYDLTNDPGETRYTEWPREPHPALEARMEEIEALGASGLQILVAPSPERDIEVTGSVGGEGVTLLPTASAPDALELDEETQSFRFRLLHERARGFQVRAFARLNADVTPSAAPRIHIRIDGRPVVPETVHAGESGAPLPLDGEPLDLTQLAAKPSKYKAADLPEEFGVYLWYVPEARQMSDENLSPEMEEALRGLGYLE